MEKSVVNGAADRVYDALSDVKTSLEDAGHQAKLSAQKAVREIKAAGLDVIQPYAEASAKVGKRQLETVEEYVRENPVQSILLSALAGALLGRVIKF